MIFSPILLYARKILCIDLFFTSPKQRDTDDLTAENNELKLQLQALEQQLHLQERKNLSLSNFAGKFWSHPFLLLSLIRFGLSRTDLK